MQLYLLYIIWISNWNTHSSRKGKMWSHLIGPFTPSTSGRGLGVGSPGLDKSPPGYFLSQPSASGLHPRAAPHLPGDGESLWSCLSPASSLRSCYFPWIFQTSRATPQAAPWGFCCLPREAGSLQAPCSKISDISTPLTPTVIASHSRESSQTPGSHSASPKC